jgi:hypothetical protein
MKLTPFGLTTALLTICVATPVIAQERDARRREAARAEQNAQRQAPQREAARSGEQPRAAEQPRRAEQARPRQEAPRVQAPVQAPSVEVAPRADTRGNEVVGRAVPRTSPSYNDRQRYERERNDGRYYGRNDRYYGRDNRYYNYAPRYYAPHAYIARPYVFRPHLSIGFGIFAGYPVPYAWRYSAPVYVYGYRAPRAPVYIAPGAPLYGGVALEISPYDADVYVDGNYAGKVADFDGTVQPLTVIPGTHRIEVQAPGYAPLIFDVTVDGGQVVPYRGDLRPF